MRILVFILLFSSKVYGQFSNNNCDSLVLSKEEYIKCQTDSVYLLDISHKMNFISKLKTEILPVYRDSRKKVVLSGTLRNALDELKLTYNIVLKEKTFRILETGDSNQLRVQPKSYISLLLSLELFKIYPDVQGVLLNEIHIILEPKTTLGELSIYQELVGKVINLIPNELEKEILTASNELYNFKIKNGKYFLFLGEPKSRQKELNMVNYLLWSE